MTFEPLFTAFQGQHRLITGPLQDVLTHVKTLVDSGQRDPNHLLLILDDQTGKIVDFNLTGTLQQVLDRHAPTPRSGPGRPRLGVVSREVSLLPRHWDWLEQWPNGASAALRRLIDEARRADPTGEARRQATTATDRFLSSMAGNLPGAEEASRALYQGDAAAFQKRIETWPDDIRQHALHLAAGAWPDPQ